MDVTQAHHRKSCLATTMSSWYFTSSITTSPHYGHPHRFLEFSTAIGFHIAPQMHANSSCLSLHSFLPSVLVPFQPVHSPPTDSILFSLPRETYAFLIYTSSLSNNSGSVDSSLIIIYLTDNIGLWVNEYNICLPESGYLTKCEQRWSFSLVLTIRSQIITQMLILIAKCSACSSELLHLYLMLTNFY